MANFGVLKNGVILLCNRIGPSPSLSLFCEISLDLDLLTELCPLFLQERSI